MARPADFDLAAALAAKNFTPAVKDAPALVGLLATGDEPTIARAQAALAGLGEPGRVALDKALADADEAARSKIVQAIGLHARRGDAAALARLITAIADPGPRVRRAAIAAIGKLSPAPEPARAAVLARWDGEGVTPDERRTLAEALGKLGGDDAVAKLRALDPAGDAELARRRDRGLLVADRGAKRGDDSEIRTDLAPPAPVAVVLHCKPGIAQLLVDDLRARLIEARAEGDHAVHIALDAPWDTLFASRLWTTAGIRVPRPPGDSGDALVASIVAGLTAAAPRALMAAWTRGPLRWRLELPEGKQRAVVWRVARDVTTAAPELVNDPTATAWDVRIAGARALELIPRRAHDPRFAYRRADVPAGSHPTVAAALARVAEPRDGDRVWDPFCGSGLELIECAQLANVALAGTDLDERALAAARANLAAAKLTAELSLGDSRAAPGNADLELAITNPPLGSRVQVDAGALLVAVLPVIARRLARGGRLVWITPAPQQTAKVAEQLGLTRVFHTGIDLGGVRGRLERWRR